MKKVFSIVFACALLLSLASVVSLADNDSPRRIPLLGVVTDGTTEIPANDMGGVTLPGTGGWTKWTAYWADEVADFTPTTGEQLYLVYDITVPADTNVQFAISGWNNPISKELAGNAAVCGESDVYSIPTGTYSGTLTLDRTQIGENGRIGVLGNGVEIRTCALVCIGDTTQPSDSTSSQATDTTATAATQSNAVSTSYTAANVTTNHASETGVTEAAETMPTESTSATEPTTTDTAPVTTTLTETPAATSTKAPTTTSTETPTTTSATNPTPAQTTAPTAAPTTATTTNSTAPSQPAVVTKGDANDDGAINMKDVLVVRKHIAGFSDTLNRIAADVNNDSAVNMKDVLLLRKYIASLIDGFDDVDPETSNTTPQSNPVTNELNLIGVITDGTNEGNGLEIKDEGNGFVITQDTGWHVWVLYFDESAPQFRADEGETVFLEYDMTLNGDTHLNVNGWNNSIAAAIADASGVETTPAEDGTPMLIRGTYKGKVPIDPTLFGETGRLGIVGQGAIIRTFKLISEKGGSATTAASKETTQPITGKTTATTAIDTPHLHYATAEKFGSLGVWWWNASQITNETTCKQRLDFLQQNHVTEIYLCVGNQSNTQLAAFIRDAASRGMRVAWLSGDVSWIQSDNRGFDEVFSRFKAYQSQAAADEKFYGIHLDVEPHQAGSTQENWNLYAALVLRATKAAHDFGTVIEWDIPFWLDDMSVTVDGTTETLLDLLARTSDTLTLMSYRDTASAILDISSQELARGATYHCKIVLGVETYSKEGAHVSFMEDGKAAMYSAMETVLTALSGKDLPAGYGGAIHYVDTWINLKN